MSDDIAKGLPARPVQLTVLGSLSIRSGSQGDVHTIHLFGHLDDSNADGAKLELQRVTTGTAASIIIDLSDLESIDSAGVRLLLRAHAQAHANDKHLTLARPTAAARRTLEQAGAADLLPSTD